MFTNGRIGGRKSRPDFRILILRDGSLPSSQKQASVRAKKSETKTGVMNETGGVSDLLHKYRDREKACRRSSFDENGCRGAVADENGVGHRSIGGGGEWHDVPRRSGRRAKTNFIADLAEGREVEPEPGIRAGDEHTFGDGISEIGHGNSQSVHTVKTNIIFGQVGRCWR